MSGSPADEARTAASGSDQTRERILRATASLLAERGYGQTRLGDIAERAALRSPAIYYYFSSRDDLVAETLRAGQQRVREHVEAAVTAAGDDWLDCLDAAVEAHLRIELELADFAAAVTRNTGHVPASIRERVAPESQAYHDLWRALLLRGQAAGALRGDLDLRTARLLVVGALNWAVEWWRPERPLEKLIATAQAVIRNGLRGR